MPASFLPERLSAASEMLIANAAVMKELREAHGRAGGSVGVQWYVGAHPAVIAVFSRELEAYLRPSGWLLVYGICWPELHELSKHLPQMTLFDSVHKRPDGALFVALKGPEAVVVPCCAPSASEVDVLANMFAQICDPSVGDFLDLSEPGNVLLVQQKDGRRVMKRAIDGTRPASSWVSV